MVGGHRVRTDIDATTGFVKLIPWSKQNNPETFRLWTEAYDTQAKAGTLKITLSTGPRLHVRRVKVGYLKTAFLAAFAKFGYRYAFHPELDAIRTQILDPEAKILPNWWLAPESSSEPAPAMGYIRRPFEGLAVYLRTGIVVLPWPGAGMPYARLQEGPNKFKGTYVDWPRGMELELDFQQDSNPSAD